MIYLKEKREDLLKLERENVFDRLRFTVVVCGEEDHAFSFFDSQNNRGVTLSVDDYLKAYHLRAVSLEAMQERLAQYWEGVSLLSQKMGNEELGWSYLFYKVLFRARRWRGNECVLVDDKEKVLEVFQKDTRRNLENDTYPLFQNKSNQRFRKVVVTRSGEACLVPELTGKEGVELPYCLRQPLYKGYNFFEYARKYCSVYQLLFGEECERRGELAVAIDFYEKVYTNDMSVFLRHFMKLCLVMYYDVFGEEGIERAVQYFDYFIGSIRLEMQYVKKEAVKNSLIWRGHNLLDVIAGAYIPEEVFHFIKCEEKCKEIYNREDVPEKDGVRLRYKKRVLAYYKEEGGLQNRLSWIK